MVHVVAISDTHNRHGEIDVPDGDVLIHAGDFTSMGRPEEIESFAEWFNDQPHKYKIVVPGNHDLMFERNPLLAVATIHQFCPDALVLMQVCVVLDGVRFYGDPYTLAFGRWAFQYDAKAAPAHWASVHNSAPIVDVLITHGPPKGILDRCPNGSVGCPALTQAVLKEIRPQHHVFGHIHESPGSATVMGVQFHNASMLDGRYDICDRKPIEFDVG